MITPTIFFLGGTFALFILALVFACIRVAAASDRAIEADFVEADQRTARLARGGNLDISA